MFRSLALLLCVAPITLACSSGGGGGGSGTGGSGTGGSGTGGGSNADCTTACAKQTAAGCPNEESAQECMAVCQAYSNQCSSEIAPFLDCIINTATFSCSASGEAQTQGCESQQKAGASCTACVQVPGDSACGVCGKASCCPVFTTYVTTADAQAYTDCINGCTNPTCAQNCDNQYPAASTAFQTVVGCLTTNCASECAGP